SQFSRLRRQDSGAFLSGERKDGIAVQMPFQFVGDLVQCRLDASAIIDFAAANAKAFEKPGAEGIRRQKTVQIGANHLSIRRHGPVGDMVDFCKGTFAITPGRTAEMDFVAFQRQVEGYGTSGCVADSLFRLHHRLDVEEPESFRLGDVAFYAVGLTYHAPQHLKAAANADDMSSGADMGNNVTIPAILTEEDQVGDG